MDELLLAFIFFLISIIYSSVGFGGGSSYLAIMSLFGFDFKTMRAIALFCNIIVVSGGTYLFYKNGYLKFRKVLPIILFSVPMAFLGGYFPISQKLFFVVLAFALFIAGILMLIQTESKLTENRYLPSKTWFNSLLGAGIGFLSGMIGIGGGIFLAPVLHLIKWDNSKVIAATASFFILVNSFAGIFGQVSQFGFEFDLKLMVLLAVVVFIGGQIGSRLAILKFPPLLIKRITAGLIIVVAIRLMFKFL